MNDRQLFLSADEVYRVSLDCNNCVCAVSDIRLYIQGTYHIYYNHKLKKQNVPLAIPLSDVLRVGITKTYSRTAFLFSMFLGMITLFVNQAMDDSVLGDIYEFGQKIWNLPDPDNIVRVLAVLFVLSLLGYLFSYRNWIEVNTTRGRFCLSKRGISKHRIEGFGKQVAILKQNRTR